MKLDDKEIAEFLENDERVNGYDPMLKALWYDGNGNWERAHDEVDGLEGKAAARIHAYLHRKEGDEWNASYWYKRADETKSNLTLVDEWRELLSRYLKTTK